MKRRRDNCNVKSATRSIPVNINDNVERNEMDIDEANSLTEQVTDPHGNSSMRNRGISENAEPKDASPTEFRGFDDDGQTGRSRPSMDCESLASSHGDNVRRIAENECKALTTRIESIQKTLSTEFLRELPIEGIELYLKQTEMYYGKFLEHHMQRVGVSVLSNEEQQRLYDEHNKIDAIYLVTVQALQVRLNQLKRNDEGASSVTSNLPSRLTGIDKIRLEKFDGDFKRWSNFKSMFTQLVHEKNYETAAKLNCLSNHLVTYSEPHYIVDGFNGDGSRYEEAWKTLCEFYDDVNKQVTGHIEQFLDMSKVEVPNRNNLMQLVTKTKHLTMSLPKYDVNVSSWDAILVVILLRKLDNKTKTLWIRDRTQKQIPELAKLLEFITVRANSLEPGAPSTDNSRDSKVRRNLNQLSNQLGNQNTANAPDKRQPCPWCYGPHRLFECNRYIQISSNAQRKETCMKLKVCFACLRKGCQASRCTMHRCKCGKPHNSSICPVYPWKIPTMTSNHTAATASTRNKDQSTDRKSNYDVRSKPTGSKPTA